MRLMRSRKRVHRREAVHLNADNLLGGELPSEDRAHTADPFHKDDNRADKGVRILHDDARPTLHFDVS